MINCEVWAYGWLKTTLMLTNSLEGFVELTQSHTLTVMVSYSGRTQIKISQGTRCIEPGRGKLSRLMSIESVTPSNHLILCHPLLLLPSVFQDLFQWVSSASGGQSIGASAFSASMVLWTVLIPPSSDVWHTQRALPTRDAHLSHGLQSFHRGSMAHCHHGLTPLELDMVGAQSPHHKPRCPVCLKVPT